MDDFDEEGRLWGRLVEEEVPPGENNHALLQEINP